jgi:hypothetical protein
MGLFRILMALAILAVVMPEVLRAPLRFVAQSITDFAGEEPADAAKLARTIAELCAKSPEACTAAARISVQGKPAPAKTSSE